MLDTQISTPIKAAVYPKVHNSNTSEPETGDQETDPAGTGGESAPGGDAGDPGDLRFTDVFFNSQVVDVFFKHNRVGSFCVNRVPNRMNRPLVSSLVFRTVLCL